MRANSGIVWQCGDAVLDVEDYRQWLRNQPIEESTRRNQVSRVRRLEHIFGDLDQAHAADALAGVIAALDYSPSDAARRKPLPPKLQWSGDIVSVMQTLRHAANTYRRYLDERRAQHLPAARPSARRTRFEPLQPPLPAPTRTLPPTGFWTFQANTATWDIDAWARHRETALAYRVSKDDLALIQVGDLGLIRRVASGRHKAAIVAIVEVVEPVSWRADPDARFYRDKAQTAAKDWRVGLAVRAIAEEPLLVTELVDDAALDRVRRGWQRTTTPIPRKAFERVAALLGLTVAMLEDQRAARARPIALSDRPRSISTSAGWSTMRALPTTTGQSARTDTLRSTRTAPNPIFSRRRLTAWCAATARRATARKPILTAWARRAHRRRSRARSSSGSPRSPRADAR
jgi:hypothetical protein